MNSFSNKILLSCILLLMFSSLSFGAKDATALRKVNKAINYLNKICTDEHVNLNDLRLSPVIVCENWKETPWEAGISIPENKISEILQKIPQFENAGDLLVNHAISLSVSSERFATTGQPILILNVMGKLYSGNLHADNLFRKQNNRIINVFSSILKTTTFTPQIQHSGAEVNNNLKGKHWLTNVRVDGNGHVQISGYGLKLSYITELTEKLEDAGTCKTIRLNSLNKNTYRKIPVWRFDLTAKLN